MHAICRCLTSLNLTEDHQELQEVCQTAYGVLFPIILFLAVLTNIINMLVLLQPHQHLIGAFRRTVQIPGASGRPPVSPRAVPTASGRRSKQHPTRTYLLWLSLSHGMICVIVIIAWAMRLQIYVTYSWAFYLSHFQETLYNVFNCSCAYIILGLSVDRYWAVCHPHTYSAMEGRRKVPRRIALAYAVPAMMYLPSCFSQSPQYSPVHQAWTVTDGFIFDTLAWRTWSASLQLVHRIAPSILLVVLNLRILCAVVRLKSVRASVRARPFEAQGKNSSSSSSISSTFRSSNTFKREQQIIYLLLALTLTFLLTNLPAASLTLVYTWQGQHCSTSLALEVVRAAANCVELAGVCGDFFLYFLMNPEYRRDLHVLLLCLCGCSCTSSVTAKCPLQDEVEDQRPTAS